MDRSMTTAPEVERREAVTAHQPYRTGLDQTWLAVAKPIVLAMTASFVARKYGRHLVSLGRLHVAGTATVPNLGTPYACTAVYPDTATWRSRHR